MSENRFTIKPQDDYWAVVDNYSDDKVCIINGIHTEIEAIWLCDFMNEQQATIRKLQDLCGESDGENAKLRIENKRLQEENEQLKRDEQLYAKEILRLKEELKEKEIVKLGGDY